MLQVKPRTQVKVELFATNLHTPSHMEWTRDGRLLVSEHTAGRIMDITHGGDMRDVKPFAYGLKGPAAILPLEDGRILVSEMYGGRIVDVSVGGDISSVKPFAEGLRAPYGLTKINQRIVVVERAGASATQLTQLTDKETSDGYRPYLRNIPAVPMPGLEGLVPLEAWPDRFLEIFNACDSWITPLQLGGETVLMVNISPLGQLLRVPEGGGEFFDLVAQGHLVATGLGWMGGMVQHPHDGQLYVTQPFKGSVIAVDPTGAHDYRFNPPVVQGLNMPTCVRFSPDGESMVACSIPTGSIWKITNFA